MRALFALLMTVLAAPAMAQGPAPGQRLVRFETTLDAFTVALNAGRAPLEPVVIRRAEVLGGTQ